ncbi:lactonase family protein [Granulicella sp. 5B5]|uniref:lactonase family protein n=1 Tax=Granulicella sp. 5B5 TaxID=1617967 RepID=UPI002103545F|nr:lactonase family protein [Granulicella sp. 5B5]
MKVSRRGFVAGLAAMPLALRQMVAEGVRNPKYVLLGTDKGKGIYRAAWNPLTGEIGMPELAVETDRPTYFAMHPKKAVLYAANESNAGNGAVSAFKLETHTAQLEAMGKVSTEGNGPCYVSVDQDGRNAFAANYGGGSLAAFGLKGDGTVMEAPQMFACDGNAACGVTGPVAARQDKAHLHCAVVSPDNRYVLVCNLGEDAIEVFPLDSGGKPPLDTPKRFAARAGSGPRHVVFHPNGRWVYCIHELDCTVDVYEWRVSHKDGGTLMLLGGSTVQTVATGSSLDGNTACELVMSDRGKFVYANTRGENSLVVYRVNEKTGFLTEQQRVQTGGTVTRLIALDPSRKWLLCMNQGSSSVTVFSHDEKTGMLGAKPRVFAADTPMCVAFA